MTVEELLKPRYKVIVDYPNNPFDVGQILEGESYKKHELYGGKYPHIFRELHWSEYRKPEDLPKYLKGIKGSAMGKFYKIADKSQNFRTHHVDGEVEMRTFEQFPDFYIPASKEEYEAFMEQNSGRPK